MTCLLMTSTGGVLSAHLIRQLKNKSRHDLRIIAVDTKPDVPASFFADEFAVVPLGSDPSYAQSIEALVKRSGVDIVIPASDEEALSLARDRKLIEQHGCQVACTDYDTLMTVSDKARCYEHLETLGITTPQWARAFGEEEIHERVAELLEVSTMGVVVKPAVSRGGRDVIVITRAKPEARYGTSTRETHLSHEGFRQHDLTALKGRDVIVMERLVEPVFDIDMLAWQGEPVRVTARRRRKSDSPNDGHTFLDRRDMIDLGTELIRKLSLSWLYDCDVMMTGEKEPAVLEINPRPSGSIAVTVEAGVPLIDDLVSLSRGEAVPPIKDPAGKTVVPFTSIAVVSD